MGGSSSSQSQSRKVTLQEDAAGVVKASFPIARPTGSFFLVWAIIGNFGPCMDYIIYMAACWRVWTLSLAIISAYLPPVAENVYL